MLSRILPPAFAAISGFFLFLFPFENFQNAQSADIMKMLTVVIVYLISDTFARSLRQDAIINEIVLSRKELSKKIEQDSDLIYYGKNTVANRIISEKIKYRACQVRNTLISSDVDHISRSANEETVAQAYIEMLSRDEGNNWFDIISPGLQDLERYKKVGSKSGLQGRLIVNHLPESYSAPHINFIILEYPNGSAEVFFGWLFTEDEGMSEIFGSTDPRLVSLFQNHFATLRLLSD